MQRSPSMWTTLLPNRRRSAAPLLALLLHIPLGVATVHAADGTHVKSSRDGDAVEIRATAELDADRDTAWRVLTDYGRYPAFIPGLTESRVVSRSGADVTVEQTGTAALFGPLRIPLEITFRIQESPPDALESHAVSGSLMSLDSRYTLSSRGQGCLLIYAGRVRTRFPLFGSVGQAAVEDNVARQFRALVDEIERQHRSGPASSAEVVR